MRNRLVTVMLIAAATASSAGAAQQQALTIQILRGYLDKMGLRYVPHPKNSNAVVVPRSENKIAERLDLYVEVRKDQSIVLSVYPRLHGRYFTLERTADREKLFQRLLETNQRSFASFFIDGQGDIGARFTFTTEGGVSYDAFRVATTELLRIADEFTPTLDEYMRKEQPETPPQKGNAKEKQP